MPEDHLGPPGEGAEHPLGAGPVQRRLGLASVRLDVAGKRVSASIQDRGAAEAGEILATLPDLARDARTVRGLRPGPAVSGLASES
jgi:hypothetical protein